MKKINLNVLFLLLVTPSILLSIVMFIQWNPITENRVYYDKELKTFYIDKCDFSGGRILVQGWSVLQGKSNVLTDVYAETSHGKYSKVEKSTQIRPDVVQAFGGDVSVQSSGFVATKRIIYPRAYTGNVMILTRGNDGEKYAAFRKCK